LTFCRRGMLLCVS